MPSTVSIILYFHTGKSPPPPEPPTENGTRTHKAPRGHEFLPRTPPTPPPKIGQFLCNVLMFTQISDHMDVNVGF